MSADENPRPAAPAVYGTARQGLRSRAANAAAARSRAGRAQLYRELIQPRGDESVLDVGCGELGLAAFEPPEQITGTDIVDRPAYAGARFVLADATDLPFADGEFDVAYSNSLLEHLEPAVRPRFAAELRRTAGRYFVQTPNYFFPIEPHSLVPGLQFLPLRARRRAWRLGVAQTEFEDIRLLRAAELQRLFPDAVVVRERVGPLTKSLVAAGPIDRIGGASAARAHALAP
jgi:SAM-dependent methyltransferase